MKSLQDVRDAVRDLAEQDDESGPWRLGEAIVEWLDDSLDAAWAEAEAALPEGWALTLTSAAPGPAYYATANAILVEAPSMQIPADTPAAALRALAAKLREGRE